MESKRRLHGVESVGNFVHPVHCVYSVFCHCSTLAAARKGDFAGLSHKIEWAQDVVVLHVMQALGAGELPHLNAAACSVQLLPTLGCGIRTISRSGPVYFLLVLEFPGSRKLLSDRPRMDKKESPLSILRDTSEVRLRHRTPQSQRSVRPWPIDCTHRAPGPPLPADRCQRCGPGIRDFRSR